MPDNIFKNKIRNISEVIRQIDKTITFNILEIGALQIDERTEPFYQLLDLFPGSNISAFEPDKDYCKQLNQQAESGLTYYPTAIGRTEETCAFYETNNPMCNSLYKPNEDLIDLYQNLETAKLKSINSIDVCSLDYFIKENNIAPIDFIKIDIQGAELDAFQGGVKALQDVFTIITEVEFIPIYQDQPLFGEVCTFLSKNGFMFHKFLDLSGRTLKPIKRNNDINSPTQHIWSDAIFITDILKVHELPSSNLLKMGLIAFMYGSIDITFKCFKLYDERNNTNIIESISKPGIMEKSKS